MALSIRSIGQWLIIHVIEDGADADLSGYSTREFLFVKPDGTEVAQNAEILTPPGLDGRLYFEIPEGFLSSGRWTVRPKLTKDSTHIYFGDSIGFVPGA